MKTTISSKYGYGHEYEMIDNLHIARPDTGRIYEKQLETKGFSMYCDLDECDENSQTVICEKQLDGSLFWLADNIFATNALFEELDEIAETGIVPDYISRDALRYICEKSGGCECALSGICPYFKDETGDLDSALSQIAEKINGKKAFAMKTYEEMVELSAKYVGCAGEDMDDFDEGELSGVAFALSLIFGTSKETIKYDIVRAAQKSTAYYCPNCSDPSSEAYCTDEATVRGNAEAGWQCDICGCHTFAPEEDLCVPA